MKKCTYQTQLTTPSTFWLTFFISSANIIHHVSAKSDAIIYSFESKHTSHLVDKKSFDSITYGTRREFHTATETLLDLTLSMQYLNIVYTAYCTCNAFICDCVLVWWPAIAHKKWLFTTECPIGTIHLMDTLSLKRKNFKNLPPSQMQPSRTNDKIYVFRKNWGDFFCIAWMEGKQFQQITITNELRSLNLWDFFTLSSKWQSISRGVIK